jgi:hypothetical protein
MSADDAMAAVGDHLDTLIAAAVDAFVRMPIGARQRDVARYRGELQKWRNAEIARVACWLETWDQTIH